MLSLVSTTGVVEVHSLGNSTVIFASCDSAVWVKLSAGGGKQLPLLRQRMSLKSSFSLGKVLGMQSCWNTTRHHIRGPVRGVLYVLRLNFKRFYFAISEGSHVAVGISSKAIDIDIDKFYAVTVLVYINTCVTCKLSIRRVWRYNGNSARRLWLFFMVTEVRQGVLNTKALAGNRSLRHWSPFLCCLMAGFANGPFAGGGIGHFVWILSLSFSFLCFGPTFVSHETAFSSLLVKFPWRLTFIFSYVWYQLCWEYPGNNVYVRFLERLTYYF